jgi:hypothetical protein
MAEILTPRYASVPMREAEATAPAEGLPRAPRPAPCEHGQESGEITDEPPCPSRVTSLTSRNRRVRAGGKAWRCSSSSSTVARRSSWGRRPPRDMTARCGLPRAETRYAAGPQATRSEIACRALGERACRGWARGKALGEGGSDSLRLPRTVDLARRHVATSCLLSPSPLAVTQPSDGRRIRGKNVENDRTVGKRLMARVG